MRPAGRSAIRPSRRTRYRAVSLGMPVTRPAAPLRRSDPITAAPPPASEARPCGRDAKPTPPGAASASSPHSSAPATTEPRSASPQSTPSKPPRPQAARPAGRASPAPPCNPFWPPNTSARSGSPAASGSSNTACLKRSASRPAWAQHPADPGRLAQEHGQLQQQVIDLRLQLEECDQDLATARSANRELMAQLNHALRRS